MCACVYWIVSVCGGDVCHACVVCCVCMCVCVCVEVGGVVGGMSCTSSRRSVPLTESAASCAAAACARTRDLQKRSRNARAADGGAASRGSWDAHHDTLALQTAGPQAGAGGAGVSPRWGRFCTCISSIDSPCGSSWPDAAAFSAASRSASAATISVHRGGSPARGPFGMFHRGLGRNGAGPTRVRHRALGRRTALSEEETPVRQRRGVLGRRLVLAACVKLTAAVGIPHGDCSCRS